MKLRIRAILECAAKPTDVINLIIKVEENKASELIPAIIKAISKDWMREQAKEHPELAEHADDAKYDMICFHETMCGWVFTLKSEDMAALYYAGIVEDVK